MKIIKSVLKAYLAILKSIVMFPSSIFWILSTFPIFGFILSTGISYSYKGCVKKTLPSTSLLLSDTRYSFYLMIIHLVIVAAFIRFHFMVEKYFSRTLRFAAPLAKEITNKYLNSLHYIAVVVSLSHLGFTLVKYRTHSHLHYLFVVAYYISSIAYNYCFAKIEGIKNGQIHPQGYLVDLISTLLTVAFIPLILFFLNTTFSNKVLIVCSICQNIISLCFDIKYIYHAVSILGNRFVNL